MSALKLLKGSPFFDGVLCAADYLVMTCALPLELITRMATRLAVGGNYYYFFLFSFCFSFIILSSLTALGSPRAENYVSRPEIANFHWNNARLVTQWSRRTLMRDEKAREAGNGFDGFHFNYQKIKIKIGSFFFFK